MRMTCGYVFSLFFFPHLLKLFSSQPIFVTIFHRFRQLLLLLLHPGWRFFSCIRAIASCFQRISWFPRTFLMCHPVKMKKCRCWWFVFVWQINKYCNMMQVNLRSSTKVHFTLCIRKEKQQQITAEYSTFRLIHCFGRFYFYFYFFCWFLKKEKKNWVCLCPHMS